MTLAVRHACDCVIATGSEKRKASSSGDKRASEIEKNSQDGKKKKKKKKKNIAFQRRRDKLGQNQAIDEDLEFKVVIDGSELQSAWAS